MDAAQAAVLFDVAASLLLRRPSPERLQAAADFFGFVFGPEEPELALTDWNEIFFVPASGRYQPPFESAFREKRLAGKAAVLALACYEQAGFDPLALELDPLWRARPAPDNLGLELAFVSALLRQSAARPESPGLAAAARHFHTARLAPWAGEYGKKLTRSALSLTFRELGNLLLELAQWEV